MTQLDLMDDDPRGARKRIRAAMDKVYPTSQTEMVGRIMSDGRWWTPRQLRGAVLARYNEDSEAITARIRELRQRGVTVESRKVKGQKCHEYRIAP